MENKLGRQTMKRGKNVYLSTVGKWAQQKCTKGNILIIPHNWHDVGINPNRDHINFFPKNLKEAHISNKTKSKPPGIYKSYLIAHHIPIGNSCPAVSVHGPNSVYLLYHFCVFPQPLPPDWKSKCEILLLPMTCLWEELLISFQVDWIIPWICCLYISYSTSFPLPVLCRCLYMAISPD